MEERRSPMVLLLDQKPPPLLKLPLSKREEDEDADAPIHDSKDALIACSISASVDEGVATAVDEAGVVKRGFFAAGSPVVIVEAFFFVFSLTLLVLAAG